jgi:hypothetical protein
VSTQPATLLDLGDAFVDTKGRISDGMTGQKREVTYGKGIPSRETQG